MGTQWGEPRGDRWWDKATPRDRVKAWAALFATYWGVAAILNRWV